MFNRMDPSKKFRFIFKPNLNIFKKNENVDLKFRIGKKEFNTPRSILPEKVYEDFNRSQFKRHKITFPIQLPVVKMRISNIKEYNKFMRVKPNQANYSHLTGNQILLTLLRYKEMDEQELSEAFLCLSNLPESKELALEDNPIIKNATEHIVNIFTTWKMDSFTKVVFSMYKLNFKNERIWKRAQPNFRLKVYAFENISSTYFAQFFILMIEKYENLMNNEEKTFLIEQLPRYLKKMHPDLYVKMFEYAYRLKGFTNSEDYIFKRHFFMIFWKETARFDIPELTKILVVLRQMQFWETDLDFYEKEFIPQAMKKVVYSEDNKALHEFAEELATLKGTRINEDFIESQIAKIEERLVFVEKKLGLINKTEFIEIIRSDLAKYRDMKLEEKKVKKAKEKAAFEMRKLLLETKQEKEEEKKEEDLIKN